MAGRTIAEGSVCGWDAVVLQSDALRVTVLPAKGADIYEVVDLESGIDALFKGPWGLQPPGSEPLPGSGDDAFMWNYEGGWQELFPNVNDACTVDGVQMPFHGEVATLPWDWEIAHADADEVALRLWTRCRLTPFAIERVMRLERGSPELVIDETVRNTSDRPAHFVWGHHFVVGPPFLEPGCDLDLRAQTIVTRPQVWEQTARLEAGQSEAWPCARRRGGGTVDLRAVPGVDTGSHDDVYVTGIEDGSATVTNPRLGLGVRLSWDPDLFGWVVLWQPYGGALEPPLTGSYALGIEPWTSRHCLADALDAGEAVELGGGGERRTTVRAGFVRSGTETRA